MGEVRPGGGPGAGPGGPPDDKPPGPPGNQGGGPRGRPDRPPAPITDRPDRPEDTPPNRPRRRDKTPDGRSFRREESRRKGIDDREMLDITVGAEGLPGILRKTVAHPERLTDEALDLIHADLERMVALAEYHAKLGELGPLLESEETDTEAQIGGMEPLVPVEETEEEE